MNSKKFQEISKLVSVCRKNWKKFLRHPELPYLGNTVREVIQIFRDEDRGGGGGGGGEIVHSGG